MLKVQRVAEAVVANIRVHVFGGILRGAQTETVQAQRVIVVAAVIVVILAARVHLAEHKLPVVALFALVVIHRDAAAVVFHLNGMVGIARDGDLLAVALARLINGVREDLEDRVLAAVETV